MASVTPPPLPTVHNLDRATSRHADERTALRSFDAYFVGEMLKRSAPQNPTGLFDGGDAGRMYQEHLYQELARIIAENGDFGLSSSLEGKLDPRSDPAEKVGGQALPVVETKEEKP